MALEEHSLPIVIVGHVDHGKSTLIGRLLYDTGSLPEEKINEIRIASQTAGREMEFSFLMDHLEEERQRGITIDISQTFFNTDKRRYVIIDAPGHKEFLKNMITGSSQAEAALLLLDAAEGIRDQTRRHSFILGMLGLKQVAVIINKMDMVDYSKERFTALSDEITRILNKFNIQPSFIVPISARHGANVAKPSENLNWYSGPTVLQALDNFSTLEVSNKPLRFPVQDAYVVDGRKITVGRVEAGYIRKGDEIIILPGGEKAHVASIEKFLQDDIKIAETGECIGLCLDKPALRGQVVVNNRKEIPRIIKTIHANIFWMADNSYKKGEPLTFKCATQEVNGEIGNIYRRFDPATIEVVEKDATEIGAAEIAEVDIILEKPVAVDSFNDIPEMGRFVLEKMGHPVGGGIIL